MTYKKQKQYRLPGYDYSAMGDYFITVCTKNRIHHFGKIVKRKEGAIIELTAIGSLYVIVSYLFPVSTRA
ncbi:MAG: hypothetical protein ABI863_23025 [Ginsengibacter sp.]